MHVNIWSQPHFNLVPIDGMARVLWKPHARKRLLGRVKRGKGEHGGKKGWKTQGGHNLGKPDCFSVCPPWNWLLMMMDPAYKTQPYGPNALFHLLSLTGPAPTCAPKQYTAPMGELLTSPPFFTAMFCPFLFLHQFYWKPAFSRKLPPTHLHTCYPPHPHQETSKCNSLQ